MLCAGHLIASAQSWHENHSSLQKESRVVVRTCSEGHHCQNLCLVSGGSNSISLWLPYSAVPTTQALWFSQALLRWVGSEILLSLRLLLSSNHSMLKIWVCAGLFLEQFVWLWILHNTQSILCSWVSPHQMHFSKQGDGLESSISRCPIILRVLFQLKLFHVSMSNA